jgi:hypothetical protein
MTFACRCCCCKPSARKIFPKLSKLKASRFPQIRNMILSIMTELNLKVTATNGDDEYAHASALELCKLLREESGVDAHLHHAPGRAGNKGDPITTGALVLTFLTSGAAVALVKVLEAYISRRRSVELELARPDGKKLVLKANDVSADQLEATRKVLTRFFKD